MFIYLYYILNDEMVVLLILYTVAARRRIKYGRSAFDIKILTGDNCDVFPDIYPTIKITVIFRLHRRPS